jgi:hypothetical protein
MMSEAERLLLADVPFIPLYTYVTKRMVNPRLKGWQSNVMDHHYSKDMFFLKAESDEPSAAPAAVEANEMQAGDATQATATENLDAAGEAADAVQDEVGEKTTTDGEEAMPLTPAQGHQEDAVEPAEENETDASGAAGPPATAPEDETGAGGSFK